MSTEASIQKGKGLTANPEFFVTFGLALVLGIASTLTVFTSWVEFDEAGTFEGIRFWAIGIVSVLAALFAIAWFSGLGEKLFVGLVAVSGGLSGILSVIVVTSLWAMSDSDGGYGEPIYAALLALVMVLLPVAAITGEKILHLVVGLLAGIWGILSVIVFALVLFGTEE